MGCFRRYPADASPSTRNEVTGTATEARYVYAVPRAHDPPTAHVRDQMKRVKRTGTGLEVELRRALRAAGLRYRVNFAPLPGLRTRADIAFLGPRVLVYVDGCFWHGCPEHLVWPKNNAEFWRVKIERNRQRDAAVTNVLTAAGWTVVRVWEHEVPVEAALRVGDVVRQSPRRW